jgi:hypothetical protein
MIEQKDAKEEEKGGQNEDHERQGKGRDWGWD